MFGGVDRAYYTKERTPAEQWAFGLMKGSQTYAAPTGDVFEAINTLYVGRRGFKCSINGEACPHEEFESCLAKYYASSLMNRDGNSPADHY